MHVALLAHHEYLRDELDAYRHLVVGLLDEQVAVSQVLPESCADLDIGPMSEVYVWADTHWPFIRRRRVLDFTGQFEKAGVTLIHALDQPMWDAAVHLGQRLDLPVVLSCFSAEELPALNSVKRVVAQGRAVLTAPSGPIAQGIIARVNLDAEVRVIPPGVHLAEGREIVIEEDTPFCIVVSGSGVFNEDYELLLHGVRRIANDRPQTQLFFEGRQDQHSLWQVIKKLQLEPNISLLPKRLREHSLLLSSHAIVHPHALGYCPTLTLQAMARGVPVLAREDPWSDHLIDDTNAWVVAEPSADRWEKLLRRVLEDPQRVAKLGASARKWVAAERLASDQVTNTLAFYRDLTGESMRFPTAAG